MSLHWRIALAVLCLARPPASAWVDVLPKDGGCAIQMPAAPKEDPKNPGRFSVENDSSSWILRYEPLDPPIRDLVASGNRRGVDRVLETLRDDGLLQEPAPTPGRFAELAHLARMFGLDAAPSDARTA